VKKIIQTKLHTYNTSQDTNKSDLRHMPLLWKAIRLKSY